MPRPPARRRRRGVMVQLRPSWHADIERKKRPPPSSCDKTEVAAALRSVAQALLSLAERLSP